jgi:hypothetical protein
MHTRSAKFLSLLTLLAGFTISACSAFFVPDVDTDGVARCNTGDDCPEPDDNRHISQCVYGEGQPENSDKVCSSAFRELTCSPQVQSGEGQLEDLYDDVTSNQGKARYSSCSTENLGKRGCAKRPPNDPAGDCDAGLEVIDAETGICDDPNALYPAINPSQVGLTDIAGQDVLDQLCRFYFCDESFVCDQSGSKPICRPCDPNEAYGEGGCGTLYIQGAPSFVYTHVDENGGNCNGDIDLGEVVFGTEP